MSSSWRPHGATLEVEPGESGGLESVVTCSTVQQSHLWTIAGTAANTEPHTGTRPAGGSYLEDRLQKGTRMPISDAAEGSRMTTSRGAGRQSPPCSVCGPS
ncbi:UNVERIFIED_CONTAM: hypothetical protein K2H54_062482 [Gekko kuhli]